MERRLILKYCPEDSDSGVPLLSVRYEHGAESAPYLLCTKVTPYLESATVLPVPYIEYMEALLADIHVASGDSSEAALVMVRRLEAILFGPIRCFPEA
jgi:hypothetical protein